MSEFIGSRISLISRSDIRYVGILHEINSENSTVALEQVVSFGTEGRRGDPAKEIAATDNVYEYIVFRGSDVKDLRIEEPAKSQPPKPQVPDDPAILTSTARPPTQNFPAQQPQQPPQPQHPQFQPQPMHPYYQQNPQAARYGYPPMPPYGGVYGGYPAVGPPGQQQFPPQQAQQPPAQPGFPQRQPPPGQAPIGQVVNRPQQPQQGGQGSTLFSSDAAGQQQTSQPLAAKAPLASEQKSGTPAPRPQQTPPAPAGSGQPKRLETPPVEAKSETQAAPSNASAELGQQAAKPNVPTGPKGRGGIVPALPLASPGQSGASPASVPPTAPASASPSSKTMKNASETTESRPTAASNEATAAVEHLAQKMSQLRTALPPQNSAAGNAGAINFNDTARPTRQPNNSRGRGGFRGGHPNSGRKVEVPATDYDFESANAKFNKQDLIKEVIASEDNLQSSPISNGNVTPVNGHNGSEQDETIIQSEGTYYSKTKSFFDNISCENKERAEAKDGEKRGGAVWRGEEQRKNMETFGQGSVDGGMGGHRYMGRGGWRGRGRGGYSRGGSGYRGRGFHRGGSGVPPQPNQS